MPVSMSGSATPAPTSMRRHLARGVVGFGLLAAAFALIPVTGYVSLALTPAALIALKGCPTCWVMGLVELISAGRVRRVCADGSCTLQQAH